MKKFSEIGSNPLDEKRIFTGSKISIEELIDKEIVVMDYIGNIKTTHGDDRYIVKVEHEGREYKFFTTAAPIKEQLDKVSHEDFPFTATIKMQRFGSGKKTYLFT